VAVKAARSFGAGRAETAGAGGGGLRQRAPTWRRDDRFSRMSGIVNPHPDWVGPLAARRPHRAPASGRAFSGKTVIRPHLCPRIPQNASFRAGILWQNGDPAASMPPDPTECHLPAPGVAFCGAARRTADSRGRASDEEPRKAGEERPGPEQKPGCAARRLDAGTTAQARCAPARFSWLPAFPMGRSSSSFSACPPLLPPLPLRS
jgi:hypothetical protein